MTKVKINLENDELFDDLGLTRLRESYMRDDEISPQERFAFVAEQFATDQEHAQKIYDYASKHGYLFLRQFYHTAVVTRGYQSHVSCPIWMTAQKAW